MQLLLLSILSQRLQHTIAEQSCHAGRLVIFDGYAVLHTTDIDNSAEFANARVLDHCNQVHFSCNCCSSPRRGSRTDGGT